MAYPHIDIEKKWQKIWEEKQAFKAEVDHSRPKYYALVMFPYPSSHGLHVGHPESYTASDIMSRYKRTKGFNVLQPMGWDAFGLPAEQYAIKTGIHPAITTQKAIETFTRQLKSIGFSFDWSREVSTCDPKYYKWTQKIFEILFKKGLAYQTEVPVNWCPELKTVLANEEVVDGKSERGGHPVVRVPMKQWMLKITDYSEKLLQGLENIDWPHRTKEGQRNWIGKSVGARVMFEIDKHKEKIEVFTTRPDTLFGATFMVLAPEHPFVEKITADSQMAEIESYIKKAGRKSEVDRQISKEKSGVFTGSYCVNPVNGEKIPIWIADYVMMGYGTGAIMAVPGHDERDFEFATKFGLPIIQVIDGGEPLPYGGDGVMVNSGFLDGIKTKKEAIAKTNAFLKEKGLGEPETQYRLRDWLFSRQRYWGEPFPVAHYKDRSDVVPLSELPVTLPDVADYEPSDKGESPLSRSGKWLEYTNPETGEKGTRNTDTMPGYAGSSWYFLRYCDPKNDDELVGFEEQKYWMPVDLYIGGPEHTVGHLLYSRFWQKVLKEEGLVSHDEPYQKLVHQGMILGEDGEKMSKSRGNVVNPDDLVEKYGADSLRIFLMFLGPLEKDKPWSDKGMEGTRRFLDRLYRLCLDEDGNVIAEDKEPSEEIKKSLNKTIKKVTEDIESLDFNTAISQMMILLNDLYKAGEKPKGLLKTFAQILAPFAPHFSEEIWEKLGGEGLVSLAPWPSYDPAFVQDDTVTLGVQINGKTRGKIEIAPDAPEEKAVELAKELKPVTNAMADKQIRRVIYKAGKILNIIVG